MIRCYLSANYNKPHLEDRRKEVHFLAYANAALSRGDKVRVDMAHCQPVAEISTWDNSMLDSHQSPHSTIGYT